VVIAEIPSRLPADVDAEEAVVASLMVDDEAIFKVFGIVNPEDFHSDATRWTYEACVVLMDRGTAINQVTVAHELSRFGHLDDVGGPGYLSQIIAELPTSIGVEHYAYIVQRDAIYRNLLTATRQIADMAMQGGPNVNQVLNRAEELIFSLKRGDRFGDFTHIKHLLNRHIEEPGVESRDAGIIGGIRTGFLDLDALLGGIKQSDLLILAARPSLGKTSLALNIARNAAVGQGARVAIFSLEMAAMQLAQRMLSAEAGIDSTRLRLGEQTEVEEHKMMNAAGILGDQEIYIDDTAVERVSEVRAKAHRLHRERPLDLIIVDYLQLVQGSAGRYDGRVAEVSEISRALKAMARELEVAVIACSQLSRAPEQRVPHTPMLSDLRESGSIEQDADTVIFIYREDVYVNDEQWQAMHPERPFPEGIAQIIVAKHRNGPTGNVHLRFRKHLTRFEDLAAIEPEPVYE
jgi:replicative DNA helicase